MTEVLGSRQERKQRTRQALLDAALELLADRGFAALSLREVAKAAGVVPTAFYRHFESMDALGEALVVEAMRTLRAMLRTARRESKGRDAIAESVTVLFGYVHDKAAHFRFLTRERYGGTERLRRAVDAEIRLFTSELAIDLARLPALRAWDTDDLSLLADLIVTQMSSSVMSTVDDPEVVRQAERKLRMVFSGASAWSSG